MSTNFDPPQPADLNRRSRLDLIVTFSVIAISLTSLFIALRQSQVMEKQLAASVWPYVQFDNSNYDTELKAPSISLSIANVGVGPARIVALHLTYKGQALTGWQSLLNACCNPDKRPVANILSSTSIGRVLPANESLTLFRLLRSPEDEAVWVRLNTERNEIDGAVCYCSVFDDCFVRGVNADKAEPVANCDAQAKEIQYRE